MAPAVMLSASGIRVEFGGVAALSDVSLDVQQGELCGLIGPNGAGKTTLFNVVSGFVRPKAGTVKFDGADVTRASVVKHALHGMRRTFQDIELFDDLTVEENIAVAVGRTTPIAVLLEELQLTDFAEREASHLPVGIRRRVGVAVALAGEPRLLLLDEPGAGLGLGEVLELGDILLKVARRRHCALLLVDHDMALIRHVCEKVFVLDLGKILAVGRPEVIDADNRVRTAYLGGASA